MYVLTSWGHVQQYIALILGILRLVNVINICVKRDGSKCRRCMMYRFSSILSCMPRLTGMALSISFPVPRNGGQVPKVVESMNYETLTMRNVSRRRRRCSRLLTLTPSTACPCACNASGQQNSFSAVCSTCKLAGHRIQRLADYRIQRLVDYQIQRLADYRIQRLARAVCVVCTRARRS